MPFGFGGGSLPVPCSLRGGGLGGGGCHGMGAPPVNANWFWPQPARPHDGSLGGGGDCQNGGADPRGSTDTKRGGEDRQEGGAKPRRVDGTGQDREAR